MAFSDGVHHIKSGTLVHIPGYEDAFQAGHHLTIRIDAGLGRPDGAVRWQERKVALLAGGPQHEVGR